MSIFTGSSFSRSQNGHRHNMYVVSVYIDTVEDASFEPIAIFDTLEDANEFVDRKIADERNKIERGGRSLVDAKKRNHTLYQQPYYEAGKRRTEYVTLTRASQRFGHPDYYENVRRNEEDERKNFVPRTPRNVLAHNFIRDEILYQQEGEGLLALI